MKASNGRDATQRQQLEYFRKHKGIEHARRMRDELGWRWRPSVLLWTIQHNWVAWVVTVCSSVVALTNFATNLKDLFH